MSKQDFYYVPTILKYSTMDECVKKHGEGSLVADHQVLDRLDDYKSNIVLLSEAIDRAVKAQGALQVEEAMHMLSHVNSQLKQRLKGSVFRDESR